MPAIVARFGTRFMEGGWLSLKNIAPTYVDEEVREIGESVAGSPDVLDLRLETMEGRPTCVGRAGLGGIASGTPWRAEEDGTHGAEIAHPELALGTEYPDLWFIHDKAEVAVCRDAGGDETPWFRGPSPWGGPVSSASCAHCHVAARGSPAARGNGNGRQPGHAQRAVRFLPGEKRSGRGATPPGYEPGRGRSLRAGFRSRARSCGVPARDCSGASHVPGDALRHVVAPGRQGRRSFGPKLVLDSTV